MINLRAASVALFFMYNRNMAKETVKFVFNQTTYWAGTKYQSGQVIEVPAEKADEWNKLSFGNIYKPRGKKKEK